MHKIYLTNDKNKLFLLNQLRSNNDYSSLVMSISEFKKKFYFDYDEETLFYVASNYSVTKEIAKTYLEALYFLNDKVILNEKITFLINLKKELEEKKLLIVNPFFKEWLKNYELCFYHLIKNDLVKSLILNTSKITKVTTEDMTFYKKNISFFKVMDMKDEVSAICSKIVSLIKEGIPYQNIYLTNLNEEYKSMFITYGQIFNLTFSFSTTENVYSTKIVQYFRHHITENWEEVLDFIKKNLMTSKEKEVYNSLVNFCNLYNFWERNSAFYAYVEESLKNISIKSLIPHNCIRSFDFLESDALEDAYIFLVNASEGNFPKLVRNYEYLTDYDRLSLGMLSILDENKLIIKDTLLRLNNYSNIFISLSAAEDGKFYLSPILNECLLNEIMMKPSYHNSCLFNKLLYASNMDLYYEYGIWSDSLNDLYSTYKNSNYKSFKHSFQKFEIKHSITTLSYSSLDIFNRCPFRFYLAYVLKLQNHEATFLQNIGTFYHHVLESFYHSDFDFEKLVLDGQKNFCHSKKEEFFFNKLTTNLAKVLNEIKKQETYSKLKNVLCEVKIEVLLNHDFIFKGFIDKFYYDNERIVVIDYKTGNFKIDFNLINYGIGMQLLIYAYLLSKSEFKDYKLIGFYFQKVVPSLIIADLKKPKLALEEKEYMLDGYSISNEEDLQKFDSSYEDSKVIKSLKKSSKGFYSYAKIMNEEAIGKMKLFIEEKINEAVEEIYHNNFFIAPKNIGNKNVGCEFCPYTSICNFDGLDIVYKKAVKPDFIGDDKDELVNYAVESN